MKKSYELLFRVKKTLQYNVYVLTLHSEIRDGHHFTSDYPYFLRARKHSKIRDGHRSASDKPYFHILSFVTLFVRLITQSWSFKGDSVILYFKDCLWVNNGKEDQTATETTLRCHILRCRGSSLYENMHRCLS